jgi:hypothetical protein
MSSKRAMSDIVDTESDFGIMIENAPSYVPLSCPLRIEAEPTLDQGAVDPWESIDSLPWPAPLLKEPVGVEQAYEWPQRSEWSTTDITTICAPLPWPLRIELEAEPTLDQGTVDPRESIPWPAPLLEEVSVEQVYMWPQELQESELPQDLQLPHEVPQDLDFESPTTQVEAPRKVEPVTRQCKGCNALHTEKWSLCKVCSATRYFERFEDRRRARERRSAEIGRKHA